MSTDEHNNDDHDKTELADPDDYHRNQRLKEIHQRRRQVAKQIDKVDPYTKTKEHAQQKGKLAHSVALYISELEPIEKRTEANIELRDVLPWTDASEYADKMGRVIEDNGDTGDVAGYEHSLAVYRACNEFLAEVKPLVDDDNSEWTI